jgi:hypothetical protein
VVKKHLHCLVLVLDCQQLIQRHLHSLVTRTSTKRNRAASNWENSPK